MRKISFDFDGTLGHRQEIQDFCKECLSNPELEIHITTRRYGEQIKDHKDALNLEWMLSKGDKNWLEVFELSDRLGIKRENIHFCNMGDKSVYFIDSDVYLHLDDVLDEVNDINESCETFALWIGFKDWKTKAIQLLNQK